MSSSRHLCVLIAEIVDEGRPATRLGEEELKRAVERCLNRVDLAITSGGGNTIARDRSAVISTFGQCNDAVMAACEAMDRVRKLPPVSGTQVQMRIGVHYGIVINGMGEGLDGARLILQACDSDQALASAPVIEELNPAVRKFASAEAFHDSTLNALSWPIFMIGGQSTSSLTPSSTVSLRPRPKPSSPLTSLRPASAAQSGQLIPAHRMQLKHHRNTLVVDGKRPVILLGRELGNDVVIIDPRASRQHARIERRRDGFVLIDGSSNGCFVTIDGREELCLKDASMPLTGSGRFGCGFSPQDSENDTVFFELI